jgi:hypothetical protein
MPNEITEKTRVPLIWASLAVTGCLTVLSASIWWAATVQSKLDTLVVSHAAINIKMDELTTHGSRLSQDIDKRLTRAEFEIDNLKLKRPGSSARGE